MKAFIIIAALGMMGCRTIGIKSQSQSFIGRPFTDVQKVWGQPETIIEDGENTIYQYVQCRSVNSSIRGDCNHINLAVKNGIVVSSDIR